MATRTEQTEGRGSYDPAAEVVDICRDLIRMDTTNYGDGSGPGERKAAEHVAALLDEVGIDCELYEGVEGRSNVVARWGSGQGDPLLLHGHLDVVPAEADEWSVHRFSGEVQDGYLWGRGAVDMKDFDAMLLSVVRARQRAGRPPARPIPVAFLADGEAGGPHRRGRSPSRAWPTRRRGATTAPSRWSRACPSTWRASPRPSGRWAGSRRPY